MSSRPAPRRRYRFALAAAGIVSAAVALSGCGVFSPDQTTVSYDPADGVAGTVGPVQLSDVLIVSSDASQAVAGSLVGMATNDTTSPVKLNVSIAGGGDETVTIPASTAVRLDGLPSGESTHTVPAVSASSAQAGQMASITFTVSGQNITLSAPILLDSEPYGSASPSHATSTPTPTSSISDEPNG